MELTINDSITIKSVTPADLVELFKSDIAHLITHEARKTVIGEARTIDDTYSKQNTDKDASYFCLKPTKIKELAEMFGVQVPIPIEVVDIYNNGSSLVVTIYEHVHSIHRPRNSVNMPWHDGISVGDSLVTHVQKNGSSAMLVLDEIQKDK